MQKIHNKRYSRNPNYRAYQKLYQKTAKFIEWKKAWSKDYYEKYKQTGKQKENDKKYRESVKGRANRRREEQKRKARKRGLPITLTPDDWEQAKRYFCGCAYCGVAEELQQDHFVPLSKNGGYTADNIVPACPKCNQSKKDNDPEAWCTPKQYERVMNYLLVNREEM